MKKFIYDYTEYKKFLVDFINSRPYGGRGVKAKMAKELRIHTAYVSQVLNKDANFTLEQAEELTEFLGLSSRERDYFIIMVQKERAGSHRLRNYFQGQQDKIIKEQELLKNKLEIEGEILPIDQQTYYSSWHYIAIHALISVEKYQDKNLISKKLNLTLDRVNEILDFLLRIGLIIRDGTNFKIGNKDLHLSSDSPMINKHHSNWRLQSVNSLDKKTDEDLHYSGIISITKEDAKTLRNVLVKSLKDMRKVIKDSRPEEVYCYILDMFPL